MNLSSNIPKLYAYAFLKMTLFPMAIITLFWKDQIGLSLTEILLLQGLFSLAATLLEYPSGYVSDRLGYRFALSLAAALGVAGWIVYLFAGTFAGVLAAELLLGGSYAFVSGSDAALLYETLHATDQEHLYARLDGRMTGFAQGGEAAGALLAGVMYSAWSLLPFLLQVGVWLTAFLLARSLTEPPRQESGSASHLAEAAAVVRFAFGESRYLRRALLLTAFLGLASFYPVWLIQPYMQQNGVPLAWFGPIWAGANLSVAACSLVSHRVQFHLGAQGMIWLFPVLVLAGYIGLGMTGGLWGFLFYFSLTAMRGLQGPMLRYRIQQQSPPGRRASVLSLKSLLFRLLFVLTAPLIGHLADGIGLEKTFLVLAGLFAAFLLLLTALFSRSLASKV